MNVRRREWFFDSIYETLAKIIDASIRFPVAVGFINFFFVFGSASFSRKKPNLILSRLSTSCLISSFIIVFFVLVFEDYFKSKKQSFLKKKTRELFFIFIVPFVFLFAPNFSSIYSFLSFFGILLSLWCLILMAVFRENFSEFLIRIKINSSKMFFVCFICYIFSSFFVFLISHIYRPFAKFYINVSFFWLSIFLTSLFGTLSDNEGYENSIEDIKHHLVRFLDLYLVFAILSVASLTKSLIFAREPIVGSEIFFAFLLSLFICVKFLLTTRNLCHECSKFFSSFSPFVVAATILLEFFVLSFEIKMHGMNIFRYFSCLIVEYAFAFFILSAIKNGKYVKWNFLILSLLILFATNGHFNILDIPIREKTQRLKNILISNKMYVLDSIIPNYNIETKDKIIISKISKGIKYLPGNKEKSFDIKDKDFETVFGFPYTREDGIYKVLDSSRTYKYDY